MIIMSIPKSFVTVDTAFRKDLTLQGCTSLPTRAGRLLTPESLALVRGRPVEGGRPRPLPYFRLDHESRPKNCSAITGQVPKSVLKVVRMGSSSMPTASFTPATSCMMHLWKPFPRLFNAYAKWKSRSMWLMKQTRQVSYREGAIIGPRVVVRSVLVQEARTRVLGSARMSQITTSPVVAHPSL
jgi:hypothetical protein